MTGPLFLVVVIEIANLHDSELFWIDQNSFPYVEKVILIFNRNYITFQTIKLALFLNFRMNTIFQKYVTVVVVDCA